MNKKAQALKVVAFIAFIAPFFIKGIYNPSTTILTGIIQYPDTIQTVPTSRIYYFGSKIISTVVSNEKKAQYNIALHNTNDLYLLVIDSISWSSEENTIKHLISPHQNNYKLYSLNSEKTIGNNSYHLNWKIESAELIDGIIPDNTIILILNPSWVSKVHGGDSIYLPTITLRSDLGDEATLRRATEALLLEALHSDSVHTKVSSAVKKQHTPRITTILSPAA